jgi:hypothetical protein
VKRARISASRSPKKGKIKAKPSLSLLPNMPLDVLCEVSRLLTSYVSLLIRCHLEQVFSRLDPCDLLSLAKTSEDFCKLLMSRKARSIWKASFDRVPGVPACPRDMPEPRWANLLFGSPKCQECGNSGVQRVDFALRRRLCTSCLKHKFVVFNLLAPYKLFIVCPSLVYAVHFKKTFPDFDAGILDLIPHTNSCVQAHRTVIPC